MALVDYNNKVIYWDEVNWYWLPNIRVDGGGRCYFYKDSKTCPVKSKESAVSLLCSLGYRLSPIHVLGISEISRNLFLYKGKLYEVSNNKPSVASLISNITGKHRTVVARKIQGKGLLSEDTIDELMLQEFKVEYNGKFYTGYTHLAKELGIPYSAIYKGLSEGETLEEILKNRKPRKIKDHLGNKFNSTKEMLEYWGISRWDYDKRLGKGWTQEEALTSPVSYSNKNKSVKDHLGNLFDSQFAMARSWGMNPQTVDTRLRRGWTLKEALTGSKNTRECVDFEGNVFPTKAKMAEYWGISYITLKNRLNLGWSLEEDLTGVRKSK